MGLKLGVEKSGVEMSFNQIYSYSDLNQEFDLINTLFPMCQDLSLLYYYVVVTARSSGILKAKQKLGRSFNSDKLGGIDFTKFSKLSMCSAGAGRCWPVLAGTMAWASS